MNIMDLIPTAIGVFFIWLGIRMVTKKDATDENIRQWREQYPTTTGRITGTYRNYDSKSYYHYTADIWVNGIWCKAKGWDSFGAKETCACDEELAVAYRPIVRKSRPKMEALANKMVNSLLTVMLGMLGVSSKVSGEIKEDLFDDRPAYQFKILDAGKFRNERIANSKPDGGGIFFLCFGAAILLIGFLDARGILA